MPSMRRSKKTGRYLRIGAVIAALAALMLAASGCGHAAFGMGDHHNQMHGGGGGAPQTPVLSSASEVNVEIAGFDFSPRDLTVQTGTAVTWTNRDGVPHDATGRDGVWGTALLKQNESATITFDSAGVYEYYCTVHPDMKGTLTAEPRS